MTLADRCGEKLLLIGVSCLIPTWVLGSLHPLLYEHLSVDVLRYSILIIFQYLMLGLREMLQQTLSHEMCFSFLYS